MAVVQIENAEKAFGNLSVLHGVSLNIPDGEFLVLVGPSGCGKSTLLRLIAGLDGFSGGRLTINGRDCTHLPPKDRNIAMVFQNYALYPHMTVERNMGFSLEIAHSDRQMRQRKVDHAAEVLGLTPLLKRYPRQLSGGQRQRVAMGRAIVREPAVFLFDEPLSNLDAQLRVETRAEIKRLHQKLGATIVYVTHDQIEAMTMADRIAVMNKGRVEQLGSPLELYDRPANSFVARFIGSPSMNLIPGCINKSTGSPCFVSENGNAVQLDAAFAAIGDGLPVLLGVRPEDVVISETGMVVEVVLVEPTGSETQIICRHGDTEISILHKERRRADPGDILRVVARPNRQYLFDRNDGTSIAL